MIETRILRYILAVADEQNMTRAANKLHISQATLSKQIADFEDSIGLKLFRRTNKSTTLTSEGIEFIKRAEEVLTLITRMEDTFSTDDNELSGDINLGYVETFMLENVCKSIKEIQLNNPKVKANIFSASSEVLLEQLDKGLIDAIITISPKIDNNYSYSATNYYTKLGVVMRKDDALSSSEVISIDTSYSIPLIFPWTAPNEFHKKLQFDENIGKLNIVGSYNLINNALCMVEQGIGYGLCIDHPMIHSNPALTFRPFEPEIRLRAYIITKKNAFLPKPVRVLFNKLQESLQISDITSD